MRIKALKKFLWVLNTVLVCGIVAYALFFFILGGVRRKGARSPEQVLGSLPQAGDKVDESEKLPVDFFKYIHELPINGDPPPPPVEEGPAGEAERIPPLAQNYKLLWTKVDLDNPWKSFVHLERTAAPGKPIHRTLGAKVDKAWKLIQVENWKATFKSDEGEKVTLEVGRQTPPSLGTAPGERDPDIPDLIGKEDREPVTKESGPRVNALEVRPNNWEVPPEEIDYWDEFGDEVAEDVAVLTVTDPKTKKGVGVEIKSIKQGSIVARRGIRTGDILKSINGNPVTSRQEAVNYFKGKGKGLTRYVVVIERLGKEIQVTYNVKSQ
ncbi:MAG: PDZ domain-containing protein [Planctomycetota bacterium]|jgi:hypothetical protein